MKRVLITGMSAVGKSTVVQELVKLGHRAVDLDSPEWSHYGALENRKIDDSDASTDWLWCEEKVEALLSSEKGNVLVVAGCAPNQGKFYPVFDTVIALTASEEVTRERLAKRTNNRFGKTPDELTKILTDKATYEPRLVAGASAVIDTAIPLDEVVDRICDIAGI